MLSTKPVVAGCVAAALLSAGLFGCSQSNSGTDTPHLTAEQTTYGTSSDEFRSSAISFNLAGKDFQLWKTTCSDIVNMLVSPEEQLSVYVMKIEETTNVYTSASSADSDSEPAINEDDEGELSEEEMAKIEEQAANGEISEELLAGGEMMTSVQASSLSEIELPSNTSAVVEIEQPNDKLAFTLTAVNETTQKNPLDKCVVAALDVYSLDEQSDSPVSETYEGVGMGSSPEEVITALGQPYSESYAAESLSYGYSYKGGSVQFSFSSEGTKVTSVNLSSAWAGEFTEHSGDSASYEKTRQAPSLDWKSSEIIVKGQKLEVGKTKVSEITGIESAGLNLSDKIDAPSPITIDENAMCMIEISLPQGQPAALGECIVSGIYIDDPTVASGSPTFSGTAPDASIAGLTLGASHEDMLAKLGKPGGRTGSWYTYTYSEDEMGENEEIVSSKIWSAEMSFDKDGKLVHAYYSIVNSI